MFHARKTLLLHLLALKFAADAVYVSVISNVYLYAGFDLHIDSIKYVFSILLTAMLGWMLPATVRKPSDFMLAVLATFLVLPVVSVWALRDQSTIFLLEVAAGFLLMILLTQMPVLRIPRLVNGYMYFYTISLAMAGFFAFVYLFRGGASSLTLDIAETYSARESLKAQVYGGWFAYVAYWFTKIGIVAAVSISLARRQTVLFFIFFILGLMSFFFTSGREQLVYPFIPVGLYYLVKLGWSPSRWLVIAAVFSIVFGVLLYETIGSISILSFFSLRAFFAIGQNHFLYYEFFNNNPALLFSQNLFSGLVDYPYTAPVPAIIGEGRYGGANTFSNAGLFASGFMQARLVGLMIYALFAGLIMKLMDSLVENRVPLHTGLAIGFVAIYQLVNIDLLTALLTQGVGFALVLLFIAGDPRVDDRQT